MEERERATLQKARALLIERGWTSDAYAYDGHLCLAGAILVASGGRVLHAIAWESPEAASLERLARALGFDEAMALEAWNDEQESVEPVLALLERALAPTEEQALAV